MRSHRNNPVCPRLRRRRLQRGITLIEVMIVVAIIALVSGGVALGVIKHWRKAQEQTAKTECRRIRTAVKAWRGLSGRDDCPSAGELIREEVLERGTRIRDPWNTDYRIVCDDAEVMVASNGRDTRPGTDDDIRVPAEGLDKEQAMQH